MSFRPDLRISARLGLAFALLGGLLLISAGSGILRLSAQNDTVRQLIDHSVRPTVLAATMEHRVMEIGTHLRNAILFDRQELVLAEIEAVAKERAALAEVRRSLEAVINDASSRAALQEATAAEVPYLASVDKILRAVKAGDADSARMLIGDDEMRRQRGAYTAALDKLSRGEQQRMDAAAAGTQASYAAGRLWLAGMAALGVLLAAWIGWAMTRSIVRPAHRATAAARRIAGGDLSQDVLSRRRDELGEVLQAIQAMQEGLRQTVGRIRSGADSVNSASHEIANGNQDLSSRTEQQASALEQTAASMQQLTDTVQQNAESARQANQLAAAAVGVASQGGDMVNRVVATMDEISASSRKIADIIGVIDGIAFQTNILALNAAVEAARAGEQGRGFAVVAGEVRILAQRSANAAREIKSLITSSVETVEGGHALVRQAGATMAEIVTRVQRVTDLIGEINAATGEQSAGIAQVNSAVAHLDQGTQQNAALVEQSAAAAESLRQQAGELERAVAVFRLHVTNDRPAARTSPAAPASVAARAPAAAAPVRPPAPAAEPARTAAPRPAPAATSDEWETF
jgi:methyl-accepting chemotaxis protein